MKNRIMMIRTSALAISAIAVIFFAVSCRPSRPIPVTVGELAEREKDFRGSHLSIRNAGGGKQHGVFLVFQMQSASRRHVVFLLSSASALPDGCDCFAGVCSGIRVSVIPGCPCEPPFVLVENVSPDSSVKSD